MSIKQRLIVFLTIIVSATYIFAIDIYDKKENEISKLYEAISLPEINYNEIKVKFSAVTEDKQLYVSDLAVLHHNYVEEMSHGTECSRLCAVDHGDLSSSDTQLAEAEMNMVTSGINSDVKYQFSTTNREVIGFNTYYKVDISGKDQVDQIDVLRSRTRRFLKACNVEPKESIYFLGTIEGKVEKRAEYVVNLLNRLDGKFTSYYQDDINSDVEAFYGYTPLVKESVLDGQGKETNTQITFIYNEEEDQTQIIIAFPFYNDPF